MPKFIIIIFIFPFLLINLKAESALTLGLAGASNNVSNGTYAIESNPALLKTNTALEFYTLGVELKFQNTIGLNYNQFLNLFTNQGDGVISEDEKAEIISNLNHNNNITFGLNTSFLAFALNSKDKKNSFGFSLSEKNNISFNLPRDFVELALIGNTPEKTFDFSELSANMLWLRQYTFSYARNEDKFSYGINFRYIQLYSYLKMNFSEASLYTDEDYHIKAALKGEATSIFAENLQGLNPFSTSNELSYKLINETAGSGIALDIGLVYKLNPFFEFATVFKNIGGIKLNNASKNELNNKAELSDLVNKQQFTGIRKLAEIKTSASNIQSINEPISASFAFSADLKRIVPIEELKFLCNGTIYFNEPIFPDYSNLISIGSIVQFNRSFPALLLGWRMSYSERDFLSTGISYKLSKFEAVVSTGDLLGLVQKQLNYNFALNLIFRI